MIVTTYFFGNPKRYLMRAFFLIISLFFVFMSINIKSKQISITTKHDSNTIKKEYQSKIQYKIGFDRNKYVKVLQVLQSYFPNFIENSILIDGELQIKLQKNRLNIKYVTSDSRDDKLVRKIEELKSKVENI